MKPVLRRLHSPDVHDLSKFIPRNHSNFGVFVQAMFGPENGHGEESFNFTLCSPAWIKEKVEAAGVVNGRHHLVLKSYDIELVRKFLIDYAETCSGEDWSQVANKLSRIGHWEFEDYKSPGS